MTISESIADELASGDAVVAAGWRLSTVAMLVLGTFVTALNVTMLSPLLPAIGARFRVSDSASGQLVTVTAATSAITAFVVAPWMDRWSRRAWLRGECALLLLGTLMTALAPSFALMFVARIVAGAGGAVLYANSMVAAAELFPDAARRNRIIGVLSTAGTLGSVLGLPALAQIDAWLGWRWAIGVIAIPTCAALLGAGALPAGRTSGRPGGPLVRGWWGGYRGVLAHGETVWLLGALLGLSFVWFGWLIYFGDFAKHAHGIGATGLSALFLVSGIAQMIASNTVPLLLRRWPARRLGTAAVVIVSLDLLAVGILWRGSWTLAPFVVIASAALIATLICTSILLLDSFPDGRGAAMSLQSAGFELGGSLGAAGFGATLALVGGYDASYRVLGIVAPLIAVGLLMSARRRCVAPLARA